jgi:flagellar motor protein MotB
MAIQFKGRRQEEEEESAFISMTDLMISILFIVMILMAFFAYNQSKEETVPKPKYEKVVQKVLDLKQKIVARDRKIKEQKKEIKRLNKSNEEKQDRILELEKLVAKLQKLNEQQKEKIVVLNEIIAELEKTKKDLFAEELQKIAETRDKILRSIKERLIVAGIQVKIDQVSGILRFDENSIKFLPASYEPELEVRQRMMNISDILKDELRCFTLGQHSDFSQECNPHFSIVEALQVEGHTDNIPMRGGNNVVDNLDLSAKRAATTYRVFVEQNEELESYLNANYLLGGQVVGDGSEFGQPVLSVSAYGETRPLNNNETSADKSANRRIDLRFIMTTPETLVEAKGLTKKIKAAISNLELVR